MKKQLLNIKDFVHINLSRGDKSEVLSDDLIIAEKKVDLIKQTCQTTEKKIASCLQTAGNGVDPISVEKRLKKMPEMHLQQSFSEFAELFGNESDSVMGQTLSECCKLQYLLGKETLAHEMDIEKKCLNALNNIVEIDIPSFNKSRKQLNKATSDMDSYRLKHQTAWKQVQQNPAVYAHTKVESLKKELEDATAKVEQAKDAFATETFALLSREPEFSEVFVQYFRIQADHHRKMQEILEKHLPDLEKVIYNTPKKPVFGTSLEEHLRVTGREISVVIEMSIGWLLNCLNEEGLFRIPGSTSKVRKLKSAFDAGIIDVDEYAFDPHTVAGTLKSYLRDLPEPLLTYRLYEDWVEAAKMSDIDSRLLAMWKVVESLPKANYYNLRYFIKFLVRLSQNSDSNKMSSQNLSIAIAPSLIWTPQVDSGQFDLNMTAANFHSIIVDSLINHADRFFPGDFEFVYFPINNEKFTNGEMSDSYSFSQTNNKTQQVHRPPKKPAPPVPPNMTHPSLMKTVGENSSVESIDEKENSFTFSSHELTNTDKKTPSPPPCSLDPSSTSVIYSTVSLDRKKENRKSENESKKENRKSENESKKLERNSLNDKKQTTGLAYRNKNIEKPNIPPPSIPNRSDRPHSVIERPAIAPPERPQRACDNNNKVMQRSDAMECLANTTNGDTNEEKTNEEKTNEVDFSSVSYPNLNELVNFDDEAIISIEYVSSDSDSRSRDAIAFADDSDEERFLGENSHSHSVTQRHGQENHRWDTASKPPVKPSRSTSPPDSNDSNLIEKDSQHSDSESQSNHTRTSIDSPLPSPRLVRHQNKPPRPQLPANKPRINSQERTYL